jgi:urocanate hydratase
VTTTDPGIGVARHVDAGYPEALAVARQKGVWINRMRPPQKSGSSNG